MRPADAFVMTRVALPSDADAFGHVNNVRYVDWAMEAAWAHSEALGVTFADYRALGAGLVVWRHAFDYLSPVLPGEAVEIATWIAANDGRLRVERAFEMTRMAANVAAFRGRTVFVSIEMKTGRPTRMPPRFVDAYKPASTG